MLHTLTVRTGRQGLFEITDLLQSLLKKSIEPTGLCTIFIRHTSASLVIQENADPSVCVDLNRWANKMAPENDPDYTHTMEGSDDMPAHIKSVMTQVSLSIPYDNNALLLGTWQGVFIWEHRHQVSSRQVVVSLNS